MTIPPWLPLPRVLGGREDAVERVLARLATDGVAGASGPPGIGKTALAGAVVARAGRAVVAARFAGCEDAADAVRVLGEALRVRPAGDEGAVIDALRAIPEPLLVADDVPDAATLETVQRLAGGVPDLRLLVLGERPLLPGDEALGPLDDATLADLAPGAHLAGVEGNPLLARLVAALGVSLPVALERLRARAGLLAVFPMGLPGAPGPDLPAVALLPDARDRAVLRRGIAVRLRTPPAAEAATRVAPLLEGLLALAEGAALAAAPDMRDLRLLRQVGRAHPDPTASCRALAAAARLATVAGQPGVARALVREGMGRASGPRDRALLLWADGDALLGVGEVEEARARFADAGQGFRRVRDAATEAALHRRAGDRFAARGLVRAAEAEYRQARWFYRAEAAPLGVAASLRGAADVAVASGEWVGAGTLHEQVATALGALPAEDTARERANLRLAEATLAMTRGEYGRAERLLAQIAAGEDELLAANVLRRRADLSLRRGQHEAARAAAEQAAALYAGIGEVPAQAACARLRGDIAAAEGRLAAALDAYRDALRLQVRVQDLRGLLRTLEHAAVVEEASGRPDAARRRREQRAAVVGILGEG